MRDRFHDWIQAQEWMPIWMRDFLDHFRWQIIGVLVAGLILVVGPVACKAKIQSPLNPDKVVTRAQYYGEVQEVKKEIAEKKRIAANAIEEGQQLEEILLEANEIAESEFTAIEDSWDALGKIGLDSAVSASGPYGPFAGMAGLALLSILGIGKARDTYRFNQNKKSDV